MYDICRKIIHWVTVRDSQNASLLHLCAMLCNCMYTGFGWFSLSINWQNSGSSSSSTSSGVSSCSDTPSSALKPTSFSLPRGRWLPTTPSSSSSPRSYKIGFSRRSLPLPPNSPPTRILHVPPSPINRAAHAGCIIRVSIEGMEDKSSSGVIYRGIWVSRKCRPSLCARVWRLGPLNLLDLQQVGTSQKKSEREKNREKTGGGGLAFLLVYTNRKPKAPLPFPKGKALQVAKFFYAWLYFCWDGIFYAIHFYVYNKWKSIRVEKERKTDFLQWKPFQFTNAGPWCWLLYFYLTVVWFGTWMQSWDVANNHTYISYRLVPGLFDVFVIYSCQMMKELRLSFERV